MNLEKGIETAVSPVLNTWNKALEKGNFSHKHWKAVKRMDLETQQSHLGGTAILHSGTGRAQTFPRLSRSSTATPDSSGELNLILWLSPSNQKAPKYSIGKTRIFQLWVQARKDTSSSDIQGRNTLESLGLTTATSFGFWGKQALAWSLRWEKKISCSICAGKG